MVSMVRNCNVVDSDNICKFKHVSTICDFIYCGKPDMDFGWYFMEGKNFNSFEFWISNDLYYRTLYMIRSTMKIRNKDFNVR